MALEELADRPRDLPVAVAREVGEEVVLDLVGQVAAQHVQQPRTGDVGRPQHLPDVPPASGLVLVQLGDLEGLHALREVTAHDHRVAPDVAHQVGHEVGGQRGPRRPGRRGQGGVQDVVAQGVAGDPARGHAHLLLLLGREAPATAQRVAEVEVVHRDAVLEDAGVDQVPQRLDEVARLPLLGLVDAQDAVAQVVVHAEHVGVHVVPVVVGPTPLLRGRGVVPLPGRGVDPRVAHPVPLPVQHVVPDLHVVEDLRQGE